MSAPQRSPRPNPIAGYEDWPAAARSAEPYVGANDAATALGRVLGLRRPAGAPTVVDEDSQCVDGVLDSSAALVCRLRS